MSNSGSSKLKFTGSSDSMSSSAFSHKAFVEGGHQLEKLEFALAVAQTRGDQNRSIALQAKIAELGGNIEEPGT